MSKQTYKIKLFKKQTIHDIFQISLLEQDNTRKEQVETAIEQDKDNSKKYKVKAIYDSKVYTKEFDNG